MVDQDGNDMEDTSGNEKAGVRLAWLGLEEFASVLLHAGLGVLPAASGLGNWHPHKILLSPSFSWWFHISSHLSLSHPQLYNHLKTHSWVILLYRSMPWTWVNTEYSIHRVLNHPKMHWLPLPGGLTSLSFQWTSFYSFLYIPTITS